MMRKSRQTLPLRVVLVTVFVAVLAALLSAGAAFDFGGGNNPSFGGMLSRTFDGSANNLRNRSWGMAGTPYARVTSPNYADGVSAITTGLPNARFISNRIFNDGGQNLFSERDLSQWAWAWGQFIDHDMGLRDETPAESAPIAYDTTDPLETFTNNDFGNLAFNRTPAAPGTGVTSPRQQINTITSFLDASNVYGSNLARNVWLRVGPFLMVPDGYLPRADIRGDVHAAPPMDLMGRLTGQPATARVAGDVRANENIALLGIQTLFAREHNRIVGSLPRQLPDDLKFDIARRVVGAEIQFVTYTQFLPAVGITLAPYRGYQSNVNPTLTNEFAVVGYRAHSMVHGEFDVDYQPGDYTPDQLSSFTAQGITVDDTAHTLTVPLSVAFGNPDLLQQIGESHLLAALGAERQYKNDEQIDNTLRSVLFEVPKPGVDAAACQAPVVNPDCFSGVADLGADDIQRGRDHGMPSYNDLRQAYGLPRVTSFTQITGEATDSLNGMSINDPHILDITELRDANGTVLPPDDQENAVTETRRTTVAARLKAIYGDVDHVDAFVGMVAEQHVPGTEFGSLQAQIWRDQFQKLRDGDRFFYQTDLVLATETRMFGVSYRHSLAELIQLNTGTPTAGNVFFAP